MYRYTCIAIINFSVTHVHAHMQGSVPIIKREKRTRVEPREGYRDETQPIPQTALKRKREIILVTEFSSHIQIHVHVHVRRTLYCSTNNPVHHYFTHRFWDHFVESWVSGRVSALSENPGQVVGEYGREEWRQETVEREHVCVWLTIATIEMKSPKLLYVQKLINTWSSITNSPRVRVCYSWYNIKAWTCRLVPHMYNMLAVL